MSKWLVEDLMRDKNRAEARATEAEERLARIQKCVRERAEERGIFTYPVTITAPSREQALQVLRERIGYDEKLGFPYTVDSTFEEMG